MNKTDKSKKKRFTAADVLITLVVIALVVGSGLLFLFPREEETTSVPVQLSMVVHLPETPIGIAVDDRLFYEDPEGEEPGAVQIGTVQKIDKSANNVIVYVDLEKDDGVYLLGGSPVRINGSFVLETRLCRVTGTVESMYEREAD